MDTALIITALGLGFASGFHCIGMCGPIALSMGLTRSQAANFYFQNLSYQFGRIFTYSVFGAVLGIVGKGFQLAGLQSYLTIFAGVLLIAMALFSFTGTDFATKIPFLGKLLLKIKMKLGALLQKSGYKSRFLTGVLNGFLPCGMVYMALTASLAAGSLGGSAAFMALFGLGTLPFMFAVVLVGNVMTQGFRLKVLRVVPVVMVVLGGMFILRGMEIGIPYISPKKEALQISKQSADCCHTPAKPSCH